MKKSKPVAAAVIEKPVSFKKYYYILGILAFFLFANTISNGYNMDDELVTRNHKLTSRGLEAIGDIFTSSYYSDDMGYAYGYRPIVHLTFALEHEIFGEKPGVSHFFNVILYVLSVILFFKLLLKWTGERGVAIALVAALIFAVHPVHTEVVASIKNRDEILAFLFVILAGLSMEKFLDRKKWISLAWILLFFTLAMLSKKSVFPIAILFPLIAIFVKGINIKQLSMISLVLLVPAVLIGAEQDIYRMILMSSIILIAISLAFAVRQLISSTTDWTSVLFNFRLISFISFGILSFAFFADNLLYVYFSLLILIPVYKQDKWIVVLVFLVQIVTSAYFFQDAELLKFGLFICVYHLVESFFDDRRKLFFWILVTILFIALLFLINFKMNNLVVIAAYFFFLYFLRKKWIVSVLGTFLLLVGVFFLKKDLPFFLILLLLVSIVKLAAIYWKKMNFMAGVFLSGVLILFVFSFTNREFKFQHSGISKFAPSSVKATDSEKQFEDKSVLKEGRSLEMIENTLVLPHTQSQTFATGAATLGEYMRLMVFPYELSFYYGYAKTKTVSLNNPWVWISIIVHLGLVFLAFRQLKKRPLLSIGIAWYLLSILLFSNWVELVAGMVGERLAFTASAGFSIFIASLLFWVKPDFSIKKPGVLEYSMMAVVLIFAGRTFSRNSNWKTPLTLMSHDIPHLHNSAQANNLYALKLMESSFTAADETLEANQAKQRLAIQHFDKALQIWPEFFNAAYDKGRAGMSLRDTLVALDGFEKAVALGNKSFLDPYYQLGDLYVQTKQNQKFLGLTKKIHVISNDKPEGYSVLARGYFLNGYADSAQMILEKGMLKFPGNVDLKNNLELVKKEL